MNTYLHLSCFGISKLIAKEVIDIWQAVNPRLPLSKEISVVNKVKIQCFQKAKQINRKHLPAAQTKFWKEKLDTLFDISSCSCCYEIAEGFRFMPLSLVRLRTFRLST